jgi:photosystem II stability/assembly factor-like uncharacterized protein
MKKNLLTSIILNLSAKSNALLIAFFMVFYAHSSFAQWTQTNGVNGNSSIISMAVNGSTLFAGAPTGSGVYRSTDNGHSWVWMDGINATKNMKALTASGGTVYAGSSQEGIWKSLDNGATWTAINNGLTAQPAGTYINTLLKVGSRLFAGTLNGLFTSDDDGNNWVSNASLPFTLQVNAVASDGTNFFAGTSGGVYLSSDNGTTWVLANTGVSGLPVTGLAIKGSEVYVSTNTGGVFLSTDNGTSWANKKTGQCYCVTTTATQVLAGFTTGGVFISSNSGSSWANSTAGFNTNYPYIPQVTVSGSSIFGGSYRSDDNGINWQLIGLPVATVKTLFINGTKMFAGTPQGGVVSLNNGDVWTPIPTLTGDVKAYCKIGTILFAAISGSGVFISNDNGVTWSSTPKIGLTSTDYRCLVSSGGNLFIGTNMGVFMSSDNSNNWTGVNTGLTSNDINALQVSGSNLFVGTNGAGAFFSSDNGTNWTAVNTGIYGNRITSFTVDGSTVYMGTQSPSYIYSSVNNGTTWTQLGPGTVNTTLPVISLIATGSTIISARESGGVYISTDGGAHWSAANTGLINTSLGAMTMDATNLYVGSVENGGVLGRGVWTRTISDIFTVTTIKDKNDLNEPLLNIYPNPSDDKIIVSSTSVDANFEILNASGSVVMKGILQGEKSELSISDLSKGIYFVKISNKKGISVRKLVKE